MIKGFILDRLSTYRSAMLSLKVIEVLKSIRIIYATIIKQMTLSRLIKNVVLVRL